MSLNRLHFESGCSNLRLHIFTDASEEAMCNVAYLQYEASLKLTYAIGKCLVAPIRHMTITKLETQAAVYGVRLRKQILSEHEVRIDKIFHLTDSSRAKLIDGSVETPQRCQKSCRYWNPRNVHRRPQGVRTAKRANTAPGK